METSSLDKDFKLSSGAKTPSGIRISSLTAEDAERASDEIKILKEQIAANDDKYPGIDIWFEKKVLTGLRSGERKAYLAFENEKPIAVAILKLGTSAKICHLNVSEEYRGGDLSQILFIQMTVEAARFANEIHFTLPTSLWELKHGFFESFGFSTIKKTFDDYRKNDDEMFCSASLRSVFFSSLKKIPKLLRNYCWGRGSSSNDLLMSIKPRFAEKIVEGNKTVEIRKKFSQKWVGHNAILYASNPYRSLIASATINAVTKSYPTDIWSRFQSQMGCSRADFENYAGTAPEVAAIELKNITPYAERISVNELSNILDDKLMAPQSYCEMSFTKNRSWLNASYLTTLLQWRSRMLCLPLSNALEEKANRSKFDC